MSDEKKKAIKQTVQNLKQLDITGLTIIKNSSDILLTRQLMDEPKEQQDVEPQRIA